MQRLTRYWMAGLLVVLVAAIAVVLALLVRSDSASVDARITSPDDLAGFYYKAVYVNRVKLPPYPPGTETRIELWEQKPGASISYLFDGDSADPAFVQLIVGDELLIYIAEDNQYLESTPSPRQLPAIGHAPDLGPLPVQDIDEFFEALKSTSLTPYVLQFDGTEAVAGVEASVYRLYDPDKVEETLTFWIDEGAMFLLAYEHNASTVEVTLRIVELEYNPDFAPGRFTFEPPPGAEKVEPQ